ncbi:hypothetical protein D3C76_1614240 [compost metagenome]
MHLFQVAEGKPLHLGKYRFPQIRPEPHSCNGRKNTTAYTSHKTDQGGYQHHQSCPPDFSQVSSHNPLVHNLRH